MTKPTHQDLIDNDVDEGEIEPSHMTNFPELAERCEQAMGPDRELDGAIAEAIGYERDGTDFWLKGERYSIREPDYYELSGQVRELRYFTASIDAAMTLVPEGWRWQVESLGVAAVSRLGVQVTSPDPLHGKAAATPALALCAAALRARASIEGGEK